MIQLQRIKPSFTSTMCIKANGYLRAGGVSGIVYPKFKENLERIISSRLPPAKSKKRQKQWKDLDEG